MFTILVEELATCLEQMRNEIKNIQQNTSSSSNTNVASTLPSSPELSLGSEESDVSDAESSIHTIEENMPDISDEEHLNSNIPTTQLPTLRL